MPDKLVKPQFHMPNLHDISQKNKVRLQDLQDKAGYTFKDQLLLLKALIHRSYAYEKKGLNQDNETLEFLGDAVLDLAVGVILLKRFPEMKEGELTRLRASLVNESGLAARARALNLGKHLLLGKGEEASGGRKKPSILACGYEALVGAIFLDSGYDQVFAFVERHFSPIIKEDKKDGLYGDAKSRLQEKIQAGYHEAPTYRIDNEEGPAHDKTFTVSVLFRDQVLGSGRASNKKVAEQQAAAAALSDLPTSLPDL